MRRITPEAVFALLPAHHRVLDAAEGGPLEALMALLAREGAVMEEEIEQLLDNAFIETCAPWAVPYVGGTIGYRALHPIEGEIAGTRAEVANTIAYRRRKGTAAVLEQLATDVTGWPAKVVEYFVLVATCQHMNHIRPRHLAAADLRDPAALERVGGAFDPVTRSVDVRSIERTAGRKSIGGRHNLPNIGIHLYRLLPLSHSRAPVTQVDARRFLFDALGTNPALGTDIVGPPRQLFNFPQPQDGITALARPVNMPLPVTRRALDANPALWYGEGRAVRIWQGETAVPLEDIVACDLSDDGGGWNHAPHPQDAEPLVRVDPELGRISFPEDQAEPVTVTWHRGFPGRIGGGEYNRADEIRTLPGVAPIAFPGAFATLDLALASLTATGGVVEIDSNDLIDAPTQIRVDPGVEILLRAVDGRRPILRARVPLVLMGGEGARIELNGLVLDGAGVEIAEDPDGASLARVRLRHLTLIPGLSYTATGAPFAPGAPSLAVATMGLELEIAKCVTGPIEMTDTTDAVIEDSIVDAAALEPTESAGGLAISGGDAATPAGALTITGTTVIGRIVARALPLVSNAILHARAAPGEAPVRSRRRQEGCLRFSFVPPGSLVPRRYRCQPQLAIDEAIEAEEEDTGVPLTSVQRAEIADRIARWLVPAFVAESSIHPAYCQLREAAPGEIRQGASDEGEMGVWHHLHGPQRETNLRIRVEEYLRFGLEAGLFYET